MVQKQLDEATLAALVDAGVVREAIIARLRHDGDYKWAIRVKFGMNEQVLRSRREQVRLFNTIDTAAKLLHTAGLSQMTIDYT